jgi:hypothetical protein
MLKFMAMTALPYHKLTACKRKPVIQSAVSTRRICLPSSLPPSSLQGFEGTESAENVHPSYGFPSLAIWKSTGVAANFSPAELRLQSHGAA